MTLSMVVNNDGRAFTYMIGHRMSLLVLESKTPPAFIYHSNDTFNQNMSINDVTATLNPPSILALTCLQSGANVKNIFGGNLDFP